MHGQLIGRFKVLSELGKGGQGAVYLAHDPQLDRQVAIKTLRKLHHKTEQLSHEARIVSKLQHPNIVALFDAGESQGTPYLVYAYIEGNTLEQIIKKEGTLPFSRAATLACGVLDGLAYAHAQGVSHLDIKPANMMISDHGIPMIMDFGLASLANDQENADSHGFSGTPRYVAPEIISGKRGHFMADIYAVGVLLYEMVTGEFAVSGDNVYEVLNRAAHERIVAPSTHNERVDEKLEAIILKAVAKNPDERYLNAAAMKQVLQDYLGVTNDASVAQGDRHSTMEFLLRRMRSKKDFPAISSIISEINQIVSSESDSAGKLSRTILQDFALTNKLLKLVNTASYGHFGGTINTVSKAVVILGFETVRSIAASLILMEFLQNKAQSVQLKDEVVGAIFSGIVAAHLSAEHGIRDAEEIMVCAMFHNLGKMLAIFYFFDESQEISHLVEQGASEEKAATQVLGISYADLGLGVARSWNFPPRLVAGMRKLGAGKIQPLHGDVDYLAATVNLANELCEIASSTDAKDKSRLLQDLTKRYEGAIKLSEKELSGALDAGLNELSRRSVVLGISTAKSPLVKRTRQWNTQPQSVEQAKNEDGLTGLVQLDQVTEAENSEGEGAGNRPPNPEVVLSAGIQDVTTSLVSDFNLNDIFQMVLETMYRGMGFHRTLILIRDNKQAAMIARFGFGANVDAIIPRFRFTLPFVPDVFHLSLQKGLDIAIENVRAPSIADKIPDWYKTTVNAPCFILLPVMMKDKAIGLFYADMPEANSLNMSQHQLSLLRTLRNQAVLAVKQKI